MPLSPSKSTVTLAPARRSTSRHTFSMAGAAVMMRLIGEADDTGPSAKRRFSSSSSRKRKARSTMVRKTWMSMGLSQKS